MSVLTQLPSKHDSEVFSAQLMPMEGIETSEQRSIALRWCNDGIAAIYGRTILLRYILEQWEKYDAQRTTQGRHRRLMPRLRLPLSLHPQIF